MVCRAPKEESAAAIGVDTEHKGDALSAQVRSECLGGRRGERCCGRDVLSWDGGFTGELHVSHAARRRIEHWRERIENWRERKNKTPRADDVRWQIEKRGRWWMDWRSAASACETRHTLSTMLPHEPPDTSRSAATWLKVCALAHDTTHRSVIETVEIECDGEGRGCIERRGDPPRRHRVSGAAAQRGEHDAARLGERRHGRQRGLLYLGT